MTMNSDLSDFFVLFLDYLVGMWISIAHMICSVLTNHDN